MPIAKVWTKDDAVMVENHDGDVFTYKPILPDRKQLYLTSVQPADRSKEPEAAAAAFVEAMTTGVLDPMP